MSERDLRISTTVGEKYRVTRFMAEGGMGAVYEAQHLFVRRRFAIKFLRQELTHRRELIARFRHEAQAAGALENENIAAVVDFGVAGDGAPYLVMEYLEGSDLSALLAGTGPLPVARAADLVLQAALGAHAAHAAGVVHRDLKPQNLFVCRRSDGTDLLKLLDFGIAKLQASDARDAVTRTGAVLGTPAYMSPEQARGETQLDARTDVYSLGVILYELLSGHLPHPGDSHNAVIHHIATENALPLAREGDDLPNELGELITATLSSDVSARPRSAAELSERLRPFAERKAWSPTERPRAAESELGSDSTLLASASSAGGPGPSRMSAGPEQRRHPARRWGQLLGLALLASTIVWAAASRLPNLPGSRPPAQGERAPPLPTRISSPPEAPPVLPATRELPDTTATRASATPAPRSVDASVPARPTHTAERPRGRAPAGPNGAKPAPIEETAVTFDDHNPYK